MLSSLSGDVGSSLSKWSYTTLLKLIKRAKSVKFYPIVPSEYKDVNKLFSSYISTAIATLSLEELLDASVDVG